MRVDLIVWLLFKDQRNLSSSWEGDSRVVEDRGQTGSLMGFSYFENVEMSPSLGSRFIQVFSWGWSGCSAHVTCLPFVPYQVRLNNTRTWDPLIGSLWLVIRHLLTWLAKSPSVCAARLDADHRGNTILLEPYAVAFTAELSDWFLHFYAKDYSCGYSRTMLYSNI